MSEQTVQQEPPKHPGGRPTDYSPVVVGKLKGSLQLGLSVETACEHAGIAASTFYDWQNKYPEFSESMATAKTYGKLLAAQQVADVLQDIVRDQGTVKDRNGNPVKPKYSEVTRTNTAKWFLEKHEKSIYGGQSMLAAKTETNDKGGTTTTLIYATDNQLEQLLRQVTTADSIDGEFADGHTEEDSQTTSRPPEDSEGQLPKVLTSGTQEQDMAGGYDQGGTA